MGIALGTTHCSGQLQSLASPSDSGEAPSERDAGASQDHAQDAAWRTVDAIADAKQDARQPLDASKHEDAIRDAPAEAFCDAAWPTTKAGLSCRRVVATSPAITCDDGTDIPSIADCETNTMVCPPGTVNYISCGCWDPPQPGWQCTDAGAVQVDGGS